MSSCWTSKRGGGRSPFHSSQGGRFSKYQICYTFSPLRSINTNENVDKAFHYFLSTLVIDCDNCRSHHLWSLLFCLPSVAEHRDHFLSVCVSVR